MSQSILGDYLPEPDAADEVRQAVRTLRTWRRLGVGPSWIKIGRRIYYSRGALLAWIQSLEHKPVRSRRAA